MVNPASTLNSHYDSARPSLSECLQGFRLIYMQAQNLSPVTRRGYAYDVAEILSYLEKDGTAYPDRLDINRVQAYLAGLDDRGLKGTTRRRKVIAFKSFLHYLESQGLVRAELGAALIWPKTNQDEPRALSKAEYEALLRACSHQGRDYAMFDLLLQTGIRLSELTSLTVESITLPAKPSANKESGYGQLRVRRKGGRLQELVLNYKTCRTLAAYLKIRPDTDSVALFLTKYGRPITNKSVQKAFKKYSAEAGVSWAHVHTLRTTHITHHLAAGTDIRTVQHNAGHSNLATTNRYAAYVKEAAVRAMQDHAL